LSSTMLRIIREEIHGAVLFEWKSNIIIWELLYGHDILATRAGLLHGHDFCSI
jgi:hypothetical protein